MALSVRWLSRLALTAVLLSLILAGIIGWQLYQAQQYNQAVNKQDWPQAATHPSASGMLAEAYALAQQESAPDTDADADAENFQATVHAFAQVITSAEPQLTQLARYNLATLYLQRGLQFQASEQSDTALPLLELAKELYRERLRADAGHWDSKYNLEQALRAAPELAEQATPDPQRNPGPSSQAIGAGRVKQPLP